MTDIATALKDKIPGFRDLVTIPVVENNEPLVKLETSDMLYVRQIGEEMQPYTGDAVYVRQTVADHLVQAARIVQIQRPDTMLQVHYGYRHPIIQETRFNAYMQHIANRDDIIDKEQYAHIFIAEPSVAAHPTGGAVDVTIVDRHTKQPLEMGTGLQEFRDETLTFYPFITRDAWANRQVLRNAMVKAHFAPYDGEWWHFSYGDREWAYHTHQPAACYAPIDFKL